MTISAHLYVKADDENVWARYQGKTVNLAGDAGFDLYVPETVTFAPRETKKVSMGIACMMELRTSGLWDAVRSFAIWLCAIFFVSIATLFPCTRASIPMSLLEPKNSPISYLIYPRSSIANTPLRLSNSVGVVDSGYRGPILAALDNTSDKPFTLEAGTRVIQLCTPGLVPITHVSRVSSFEATVRGSRGFGSTS
jgi:dUTPase